MTHDEMVELVRDGKRAQAYITDLRAMPLARRQLVLIEMMTATLKYDENVTRFDKLGMTEAAELARESLAAMLLAGQIIGAVATGQIAIKQEVPESVPSRCEEETHPFGAECGNALPCEEHNEGSD